MPERYHIYPVRKNKSNHWTGKSGDCWCDPKEQNVCPESNKKGKCIKTCYRCGGSGLVDVYDPDLNILIIHYDGQLEDHLNKLGL